MCRAGLAVAVLDASGRLSMLSPGCELLLHQPFASVPAESLAEVFHLYTEGGARPLRPEEVPIVQASHGKVVENAVVTVMSPGQPVRHLRVNASPLLDVNGDPHGAWAVMTDVTSLVAGTRGELDRTLAETVNHNLRTPLTVILGHTEMLLDQHDELTAEARHSVQALSQASRRLAEVVTGISQWIDIAFPPEHEGATTDLARSEAGTTAP